MSPRKDSPLFRWVCGFPSNCFIQSERPDEETRHFFPVPDFTRSYTDAKNLSARSQLESPPVHDRPSRRREVLTCALLLLCLKSPCGALGHLNLRGSSYDQSSRQ